MQSNQLGPYRILEELGRGGMGIVYSAQDSRTGQLVALKTFVMTDVTEQSLSARERFKREGQLLACLNHPGIVRVLGTGEVSGVCYIAMEFLAGEDLKETLKRRGTIEPELALKWFHELARALDHVHALGILHRDIKPANIVLTEQGVKLIDFGLIKSAALPKLSVTGTALGTPSHMAPEQFSGKSNELRPAADIYSLGLTIFELLSGRSYFKRSTIQETAKAVLESEESELKKSLSELSEVPESLKSIIANCMKKDWRDRYQSAAELITVLDQCNAQSTASNRINEGGVVAISGTQKNSAIIASVVVVVLLFVVFLFWSQQREVSAQLATTAQLLSSKNKELRELSQQLESLKDRSKTDQQLNVKLTNRLRAAEQIATEQGQEISQLLSKLNARARTSGDVQRLVKFIGDKAQEAISVAVAEREKNSIHSVIFAVNVRSGQQLLDLYWKTVKADQITDEQAKSIGDTTIDTIELIYSSTAQSLNDYVGAVLFSKDILEQISRLDRPELLGELRARVLFHQLRILIESTSKGSGKKSIRVLSEYFSQVKSLNNRDRCLETEALAVEAMKLWFNRSVDLKRAISGLLQKINGSRNRLVYSILVRLVASRVGNLSGSDGSKNPNRKLLNAWLLRLRVGKAFQAIPDWCCSPALVDLFSFVSELQERGNQVLGMFRLQLNAWQKYRHCSQFCLEFSLVVLRYYFELNASGIIEDSFISEAMRSLADRVYFSQTQLADERGDRFALAAISRVAKLCKFELCEQISTELLNNKRPALKRNVRQILEYLRLPNLNGVNNDKVRSIIMQFSNMNKGELRDFGFKWLIQFVRFRFLAEQARRLYPDSSADTVNQKILAYSDEYLKGIELKKEGPVVLLLRDVFLQEALITTAEKRELVRGQARANYLRASKAAPISAKYWYGRLLARLESTENK